MSHEIVTEPGHYAKAMVWVEALIWIKAMKSEMKQHQTTRTWTLVDLLPDQTTIGCQWVYAIKMHPDGTFEKAKVLSVGNRTQRGQGVRQGKIGS